MATESRRASQYVLCRELHRGSRVDLQAQQEPRPPAPARDVVGPHGHVVALGFESKRQKPGEPPELSDPPPIGNVTVSSASCFQSTRMSGEDVRYRPSTNGRVRMIW